MSLKLYATLGSPAVRGTLLTIEALGLKDKVQIIPVELFNLEHLKPEFVAKNPLHTVPVLEDGNFTLWDSHAINSYLVNKYATDDALYPKDIQKRALVDSMAHFDTGYLFGKAVRISKAVVAQDKSVSLDQMKADVRETYDMLELILKKRKFVAGDSMTIADFSIVATLSTTEVYVPMEKEYPRIDEWYAKMRQLPYYSINAKGVEVFKTVFGKLIPKL
uniref:Glutathione S-transferase n=1 Tax=Dendroctonus armandi TaxID=77159 RepID=A0A076JVE2_9CUCU|nr:glutathione S-transferase [Dendroctonus armandi]QFU14634.1 glutathione S-transferase GSTe3 [Dendroctonus armandi]